jgi:phosphoribosylformylglycinamidine (FGAM) synthase-like enzyme
MLTKTDLQTMADMRLEDAQHLFQGARYSAAYYLSGYAVELGIKACIADVFHADAIPDKAFVNAIYTHNLDGLLGLAGIKQELQDDMKNDAILSVAWGVASKWGETSRYAVWDQFAAASMINAVGDQNHGVLQWLKKRW